MRWLAVRTRQNGKLLNSQRIIKYHPSRGAGRVLTPRPSLPDLLQTHIVDPASVTNRLHLSVPISRPSSKDLAFPVEDRDAGERRQYARIIARNDSLSSRPIKPAICWRSERDGEKEKERGWCPKAAEITSGFRASRTSRAQPLIRVKICVALMRRFIARCVNSRTQAPYGDFSILKFIWSLCRPRDWSRKLRIKLISVNAFGATQCFLIFTNS